MLLHFGQGCASGLETSQGPPATKRRSKGPLPAHSGYFGHASRGAGSVPIIDRPQSTEKACHQASSSQHPRPCQCSSAHFAAGTGSKVGNTSTCPSEDAAQTRQRPRHTPCRGRCRQRLLKKGLAAPWAPRAHRALSCGRWLLDHRPWHGGDRCQGPAPKRETSRARRSPTWQRRGYARPLAHRESHPRWR